MKSLLLALVCLFWSVPGVLAQSVSEAPAQEMLAVSLKGLKESYGQLIQRNNFLSAGIASYQKNLPFLQKELETIAAQKQELAAHKNSQGKEVEDGDVLTFYREEIGRLRRQLNAPQEDERQKLFDQKKEQLKILVEQGRQNIKETQSRLQEVEQRYKQQTKMITQIEESLEEPSLGGQTQERAGADGRNGGSLAPAPEGSEDMDTEAYLAMLTGEIERMKLYQHELQQELTARSARESGGAVEWGEEQYQLYRKLASLKEENILLKRGLSLIGPAPDLAGQSTAPSKE